MRANFLNMSVEEIDQYLTSETEGRNNLLGRRAGAAGRDQEGYSFLSRRVEPVYVRENVRAEVNNICVQSNLLREHVEPMAVSSEGRLSSGMAEVQAHVASEAVSAGYGAFHVGGELHEVLSPKYKRIEKVALSIATCCALVFIGLLADDIRQGKSSNVSAAASPQKLAEIPSSCGQFLCPYSASCASSAMQCPEGNPFLMPGSVYRQLVECRAQDELCDCEKHAEGSALCGAQSGYKAEFKLEEVKADPSAASPCFLFLCPKSLQCVKSPSLCSEGSPFADHSSLYWQEAMLAKKGMAVLEGEGKRGAAVRLAAKRTKAIATSKAKLRHVPSTQAKIAAHVQVAAVVAKKATAGERAKEGGELTGAKEGLAYREEKSLRQSMRESNQALESALKDHEGFSH
eukprot:767312-Hanusia_phi.AAC.6